MTDETFSRFSRFIQAELGIKMPLAKKTMLQARLQKRLWKLGMDSFDAYHEYVFSPQGRADELQQMIDVVTTNKTEFFREPKHFDFLTQRVLPDLINRRGTANPFIIWCAGSSTGEEPYSLAMLLSNFAEQVQGFRFLILATDISSRVLEKARLGIYDDETVQTVPENFKKKYLLRSKGQEKKLVRIVPELRSYVRFRQLNLIRKDFGLRETMDVIFCRNVIIYFNRETQGQVINRLCYYLNPGGYLFTGHSETLNGIPTPVIPVSHTVYQKAVNDGDVVGLPIITLNPAELFISDRPVIVRVVLGSCVAVTMFDRRRGVAAICHAVLPEMGKDPANTPQMTGTYQYVNSVVPIMLKRLGSYGVSPGELEVKLFGGADMINQRTGKPKTHPVGQSNIHAVIQAIKAQGMELKTSDVGGSLGRKILFYTHTGEVLLKRLESHVEID